MCFYNQLFFRRPEGLLCDPTTYANSSRRLILRAMKIRRKIEMEIEIER